MPKHCTYGEGYSAEEKICYTGCCEYDCCPSSRDEGVWIVLLFLALGMFLCLFIVCYCCRKRRSFAGQTFYSVPTATVTITTRCGCAGAHVPEHCGYDQSSTFPTPVYQPLSKPMPSAPPMYEQYQPPPPYTEQPPKAKV